MSDSILKGITAQVFESIEIISLIGLIVYCVHKQLYPELAVFLIAFFEHIRQILTGYRQQGGSIDDVLTLLMMVFIVIKTNDVVVKIAGMTGVLIHVITISSGKIFTAPIKIKLCYIK